MAGAVILVDDDGVLDIDHEYVLENNTLNKPIAGPGPWLDPHPILWTGKSNRLNCHILDTLFFEVLA